MTLKEILKQTVFKRPVKKYYFGKIVYGTPYFFPRGFNKTIISKKRKYDRNKSFKLFGKECSIGRPFKIVRTELGWKDKYNTPRQEWVPQFLIFFFKWQFCIWWVAPDGDNDLYYEMLLWWKYYCDEDINKARDEWGWVDSKTKESTWNDKYLN